MKNIKLAVVLSAVMLSVASLAQAGNTNNHFISKRAYLAPVNTGYQSAEYTQWEGATYRPAESKIENALTSKGTQHLKQLNVHSLAKRTFM